MFFFFFFLISKEEYILEKGAKRVTQGIQETNLPSPLRLKQEKIEEEPQQVPNISKKTY